MNGNSILVGNLFTDLPWVSVYIDNMEGGDKRKQFEGQELYLDRSKYFAIDRQLISQLYKVPVTLQ